MEENDIIDKQRDLIQRVLIDWNPLGERIKSFVNLDDYSPEANDILFYVTTDLMFPIQGNPKVRTQKIVMEILNEALELSLSMEDCKKPAKQIHKIIYNT